VFATSLTTLSQRLSAAVCELQYEKMHVKREKNKKMRHRRVGCAASGILALVCPSCRSELLPHAKKKDASSLVHSSSVTASLNGGGKEKQRKVLKLKKNEKRKRGFAAAEHPLLARSVTASLLSPQRRSAAASLPPRKNSSNPPPPPPPKDPRLSLYQRAGLQSGDPLSYPKLCFVGKEP
jgi:hypothetical protein